MTLKVNFCLQYKSTESFLTQIASVPFSKDDTEILKEAFLKSIGIRLQLIAEVGRFIVKNKLTLSFSNIDYPSLLCDCSAQVYLLGELKFYAQIAGREGMSSYWCMWCTLHRSKWRTFQESPGCVPER
jgi:hypothetical protein